MEQAGSPPVGSSRLRHYSFSSSGICNDSRSIFLVRRGTRHSHGPCEESNRSADKNQGYGNQMSTKRDVTYSSMGINKECTKYSSLGACFEEMVTIVVIGDYARILRMHREGLILFVVVAADSGCGSEEGGGYHISSSLVIFFLTYRLKF